MRHWDAADTGVGTRVAELVRRQGARSSAWPSPRVVVADVLVSRCGERLEQGARLLAAQRVSRAPRAAALVSGMVTCEAVCLTH